MGFLSSYGDDQQLPPWLMANYFGAAPTGGIAPAAADPAAAYQPALTPAKTDAAPAQRPGFLARLGQTLHSPDFQLRMQAALATINGHPEQAMQYQEFRQQQAIRQQELQRQLRAEQRTEQDQANQVWGMKDSGLFTPQQIAAMTPEQRGAAMSARIAPWDGAPGHVRYEYGQNGQYQPVASVPTDQMQNIQGLSALDPALGKGAAMHAAFGPDIATQPGGGVATHDMQGNMVWGVQPYQTANPQQPAQGGGGGGASNNPGGLRYPGSTRFRSFPTPAAGVAAGQAQLGRYFGRGLDTVRSIIETWAPRQSRGGDNTDAQVDNYIAHVAGRLGVSPDQHLPPSVIPQFFAAQTEIETGRRGPSPRVSAASPRGAPQMPVRVNSPEQAASLPSGTPFITPEGRQRVRN